MRVLCDSAALHGALSSTDEGVITTHCPVSLVSSRAAAASVGHVQAAVTAAAISVLEIILGNLLAGWLGAPSSGPDSPRKVCAGPKHFGNQRLITATLCFLSLRGDGQ